MKIAGEIKGKSYQTIKNRFQGLADTGIVIGGSGSDTPIEVAGIVTKRPAL